MSVFALRSLARLGTMGVALLATAAPAFATEAIPVPEPSSLSLLAAGVAGAIIAIRVRRRK